MDDTSSIQCNNGWTGRKLFSGHSEDRSMGTWQQFVIIFQNSKAIGAQLGRVEYPVELRGQDINAVLAQYSQQGFEVAHLELAEFTAVVVLKKPLVS
jgi:hypothetical protein